MITTSRGKNLNYLTHENGQVIGEAWKRKNGFGIQLNGIFWWKDEPNTRSGMTSKTVKRLCDVPDFVTKTLTTIRGHAVTG